MTDHPSSLHAMAKATFNGDLYAQDLADFLTSVPGHALLDVAVSVDQYTVTVRADWKGGDFR